MSFVMVICKKVIHVLCDGHMWESYTCPLCGSYVRKLHMFLVRVICQKAIHVPVWVLYVRKLYMSLVRFIFVKAIHVLCTRRSYVTTLYLSLVRVVCSKASKNSFQKHVSYVKDWRVRKSSSVVITCRWGFIGRCFTLTPLLKLIRWFHGDQLVNPFNFFWDV